MSKIKTYLTLIALNGLVLSASSVSAATISSAESTQKISKLAKEIAKSIEIEDRVNLIELAIDRSLLAQTVNAPQIPRLITAGVPRLTPTQDDKDRPETNDLKTQNDNKEARDNKIPMPVGLIMRPKVKMPTIGRIEHKPPATAATIESQPIAQVSSDRNAKITGLIKDLQTGNEDKLIKAMISLEEMKADAKSIVPQLVPLLKNKNSNVRRSTIYLLTTMGEDAKSTISDILPLLKDADPQVRINAINALSKNGMSSAQIKPFELGERAQELEPAIASLIPYLTTANDETRRQLTLALGNMEGGARSTVPQLTALLKHPKADVRLSASYILPRIGIRGDGAAKSAIPSLVPLLKDPNLKGDVRSLLEKLGYRVK